MEKADRFERVLKIIQALAIVIGIFFTYLEYKRYNDEKLEREKERNAETAKEIRMHFYQLQLDFYTEAVEATSILATENMNSVDYLEARKKFMRLFWGKLAIVEEKTVEAAIIRFKILLDQYENPDINIPQEQMEHASLDLAHDARKYTINVWVDSTARINYN